MTLAMHDMEIREEAREEGREEGKENATVTNLRTVMKKMKLSAEKVMDFMDIPPEDQPKYTVMLQETAPREYQP